MKIFLSLLVFMVAIAVVPADASAQQRDYLTEQEVELVRDAQDIDARIDVLTTAIDRRFGALGASVGAKPVKESDKWGPAPSGSRLELLDDIKRLLQKAIDDIDNAVEHPINYALEKDRSEKQKKKDAQRFPDSVKNLASASRRYVPVLKTLLEQSKDEHEKGAIIDSLESCDQIISAVTKLPAETKTN